MRENFAWRKFTSNCEVGIGVHKRVTDKISFSRLSEQNVFTYSLPLRLTLPCYSLDSISQMKQNYLLGIKSNKTTLRFELICLKLSLFSLNHFKAFIQALYLKEKILDLFKIIITC